MNTQSRKVSSGVLVLLLVVLAGSMIGAIGYWYGTRESATKSVMREPDTRPEKKADDSNPSSLDPSGYIPCPSIDEYILYQDQTGLEFCYPISWGIAGGGNVPESQSIEGAAYEVTFPGNDEVTISSATVDYINTIGRDGRCEDPENTPPNFGLYSTNWVKDSADSELTAAVRYPLKKDGVYLIQENVNSFFFGLCYSALVNQSGTAYPVVKVALRRELGSVTPLQYTENPEVLLTAAEKAEFLTVVETMRKP